MSLVVDDQGIAHAAAVLRNGIVYLTNRRGRWEREQLTRPAGFDAEPVIAIDDGFLWVAFTRWPSDDPDYCEPDIADCVGPGPEGIFLMTNSSGRWSEPEPIAGTGANMPRLRLNGGQIHLAYVDGVASDLGGWESRVRYASGQPGNWNDEVVAMGYEIDLELAPDGTARLLFWDFEDPSEGLLNIRLWYATSAAGPEALEVELIGSGPESDWGWLEWPELVLDHDGRAHVLATVSPAAEDDEPYQPRQVHHWTTESGAWTEELLPAQSSASELLIDRQGRLHFLAAEHDPLLYATYRDGALDARELGAGYGYGALAIDGRDRAHVLFTLETTAGRELWYAIAPGH